MRKIFGPILIALLCVCCVNNSTAQTKDWPQFRGPSGNGVINEATHPVAWDNTTNIAWSVEVPGSGWSSPIVHGNKVFLTTAVGNTKPMGFADGVRNMRPRKPTEPLSYRVICLSLAEGKQIWDKEVANAIPAFPVHASNSYATETPATDGKHVFAYFSAVGIVVCFDLDGKEIWRKDVGTYPTGNGFGPGSSLAIHGGKLFLQCDNDQSPFVVAFDTENGSEVWRDKRRGRTSWATPVVWTNEVRTELVTCGSGVVTGYDPNDGSKLWVLSGVESAFSASPALDQERIYFGNSGPMSQGPLVAVAAGLSGEHQLASDFTSDKVAWSRTRSGPGMASPIVVNDLLFIPGSRGVFSCYSAKTGEEIFKTRLPQASSIAASMWAVGDKLFLLDEAGTTFVVKADKELEVLGTNKIDDLFWSTPAIAGDSLLLRGTKKLYCIRE